MNSELGQRDKFTGQTVYVCTACGAPLIADFDCCPYCECSIKRENTHEH